MGGATIHLQRYAKPKIDQKTHHLFNFLVEYPLSISSIEIRSLPFRLNGHVWYIYMSKTSNDFISCHLRSTNLTKDLNVQLNYSFTLLHPSQKEKDHFSVKGPESGRIFSREKNTLSWGWKQFIPISFLTRDFFNHSMVENNNDDTDVEHDQQKSQHEKTNSGFIFDQHKILIQIEIYNILTWSDQNILVPEIKKEYPYPSISANPISYAGFAWQIRAFPNGYDQVSSGRLILQLFCTTSRHQCRCKIRFRISQKISSPIFEYIFPDNSISSLPNVVVLPTSTKHIINSEINIGIDFIMVTEINEIRLKLSDPVSYPAISNFNFQDIEGCHWIVNSLQGADLKVKLDINSTYRENIPGAMNYTRHLLWNLYLVPGGLEKDLRKAGITDLEELNQRKMELLQQVNNYYCDNNIDRNLKNPDLSTNNLPFDTNQDSSNNSKTGFGYQRYSELIGYFTPEFSDAEEAKTGLSPFELKTSKNPYTVFSGNDGDDGSQYLVFYIEIISNLLFYKTPAPSPIADLERLNMFSLKKEFNLLNQEYKNLLKKHHQMYLQNSHLEDDHDASRVNTTFQPAISRPNPKNLKHSQSIEKISPPRKRERSFQLSPEQKNEIYNKCFSEIGIQTDVESGTNQYLVLKRSETCISSSIGSDLDTVKPKKREERAKYNHDNYSYCSWTPFIDPNRVDKFRHCPLELICEMARPSMTYIHEVKEIINNFSIWLKNFLEYQSGFHFSRMILGGHLGMNLLHKHVFDKSQNFPANLQLFFISPDLPKAGFTTWLPNLLQNISVFLQEFFIDKRNTNYENMEVLDQLKVEIKKGTNISTTKYSVRFFLRAVMFGIELVFKCEMFFAYDWSFSKIQENINVNRNQADNLIDEMCARFLRYQSKILDGTHQIRDQRRQKMLLESHQRPGKTNSLLQSYQSSSANFNLFDNTNQSSNQSTNYTNNPNQSSQEFSLKNLNISDFDKKFYFPSTIDKQMMFVQALDKKVIDLSRFLIMWRDGFKWNQKPHNLENTRPSSWTLLLLVTRAFENANIDSEKENISVKNLFYELYDLINNKNYLTTPISWNTFYNYELDNQIKEIFAWHIQQNKNEEQKNYDSRPSPPILISPINPIDNVFDEITDYAVFQSRFNKLFRDLDLRTQDGNKFFKSSRAISRSNLNSSIEISEKGGSTRGQRGGGGLSVASSIQAGDEFIQHMPKNEETNDRKFVDKNEKNTKNASDSEKDSLIERLRAETATLKKKLSQKSATENSLFGPTNDDVFLTSSQPKSKLKSTDHKNNALKLVNTGIREILDILGDEDAKNEQQENSHPNLVDTIEIEDRLNKLKGGLGPRISEPSAVNSTKRSFVPKRRAPSVPKTIRE